MALTGVFRINAPATDAATSDGDEYLQRLIKLIPSEVIALYLTFKEITASWLGVWSLICLLLVILVRMVGTKRDGKSTQWLAVLVAIVSFILWVYATGGHFFGLLLPEEIPGIVSVAIGVWTFVVPYFYKPSETN